MPRAYDRQQLTVDRDPLNVNTDFGSLPKLKFPGLDDWWEGVVRMIKNLTGLDLSSPFAFFESVAQVIHDLTGLDFSSPSAFLLSVIDMLKRFTGVDFSSPQAFIQSIVDNLLNTVNFFTNIWENLSLATGLDFAHGPIALIQSIIKSIFDATGLSFLSPESFINSILNDLSAMLNNVQSVADAIFGPIISLFTGGAGSGINDLGAWINTTLTTAIKKVQQIIEQIWNGFGMGGLIDLILGPNHVAETMAAVNAAIVDLQQLIASLPSGVFEKFDTYPEGTSLGNKWGQKYFNGGGSVAGLSSGLYGITKGRAQFPSQLLISERRAHCIYKPVTGTNQTSGDFQRISLIFSSVPQSGGLFNNLHAWNEIRGRIDANDTSWVFARMESKKVYLGYRVSGGPDVILKSVSYALKPAVTYTLEIGLGTSGTAPRTFRLLENQTVILEAVDTAAKSLLGAGNRYCGMAAYAEGLIILPASVAAFSFYDSGGLSLVDGFGQAVAGLGSVVVPFNQVEPELEGASV